MTQDLIDTFVSLGFFGLAGIVAVMVLVRLYPTLQARVTLQSKGREGPAIAAKTRIRERLVYLWICGVFVLFGILQAFPHERYGVLYYVGVLAAYSIMIRMLLAILAGDKDASDALKTHPELE